MYIDCLFWMVFYLLGGIDRDDGFQFLDSIHLMPLVSVFVRLDDGVLVEASASSLQDIIYYPQISYSGRMRVSNVE